MKLKIEQMCLLSDNPRWDVDLQVRMSKDELTQLMTLLGKHKVIYICGEIK